MSKKKKHMGQSAQQTIIAQGVRVEGDFNSQGSVLIEGEVAGAVKTAEHLQVGETAKIHASVTAADAVVAGEIKGNVKISGRLELTETSKVRGDIRAQILTVAAGAEINGKVGMGEDIKRGGKKRAVKKDEVLIEEEKSE
jgi:cytoskeletal protein CcmA (bactofilin family)